MAPQPVAEPTVSVKPTLADMDDDDDPLQSLMQTDGHRNIRKVDAVGLNACCEHGVAL